MILEPMVGVNSEEGEGEEAEEEGGVVAELHNMGNFVSLIYLKG